MEDQQEERRYVSDIRLAKLEVEFSELKNDFKEEISLQRDWRSDHTAAERNWQEKFSAEQKNFYVEINEVKALINKYQGVVGGVMIVISALWAFVALCKDWIFQHLK